MKKTGRIATGIIAVIYTFFQIQFFDDPFQKEIVDVLSFTMVVFFLGWQYDRAKFDVKLRKESAESYKQLVELLPEAVMIYTNEKILYVNKAAEIMLAAQEKNEVIGRSVFSFILADYQQLSTQHIEEVYKEKQPVMQSEKELKRLDGKVIACEVSSLYIVFEGGEAVLSIIKDLTEQKEQTARLLQKSEKLAIVGQLAAGIAHEIRNPLTSLKGFIQLSRMQDEHKQEYFDIMLTELDRINLIVSELLGLSKPIDVLYKEQDLKPLLQDVVALINSQAVMENVLISVAFEPDIPTVFCEENQLKQVFINLLKNAIEAMPAGGDIKVDMKHKGGKVALYVLDEGIGIPEDRMPKLGEPFYTTKEKGTGLGLMTCCKIIENHGGELNIFSKVGEGTTVEIVLPTQKNPAVDMPGTAIMI
ncbi:PAS domain-containing sensor histidine kinase [Domibacillus antri]|uniref:histidine kinase n=1 Tax=Domibacillus antri TaxID=1714264 RepID=A0A1Q8Q3V7_9BACI|nr:ATP-binding protein [Domibacillus antri]OLN22029.1 PAS domain-containing sensor histidine kinase [Domibacillus antri]